MLCLIEMSREGNNNHLVVDSVPKQQGANKNSVSKKNVQ